MSRQSVCCLVLQPPMPTIACRMSNVWCVGWPRQVLWRRALFELDGHPLVEPVSGNPTSLPPAGTCIPTAAASPAASSPTPTDTHAGREGGAEEEGGKEERREEEGKKREGGEKDVGGQVLVAVRLRRRQSGRLLSVGSLCVL